MEEVSCEKIIHDAKLLYTVLSKFGISLKALSFDTKIAAYLIDSSRSDYELKDLIREILNIDISKEENTVKVKEVHFLKDIFKSLKAKIDESKMEELFYNVEKPLIEVLSFMEGRGFKVDKAKLSELGDKFSGEIAKTQLEIYGISEEEFNINSPKQLRKNIF